MTLIYSLALTDTIRTFARPAGKIFVLAFCLAGFLPAAKAQHSHDGSSQVSLHVNPELGVCDFDIAPNLSQSEWARAVKEAGNILYLDPLASPAPLGRGNWSLQLERNSARVDQESGAWNNTFHHPDSVHYLAGENGRLSVPALRFRMGLTENWDAGIYYTTAKPFGANYGFLGLETRYAFLHDTVRGWSAAARGSFVKDANIRDFNIFSAGADVTAGKKLFRYFTPYAGFGLNWNHGREVTDEVSLAAENSLAARGLAGIDFRWRFVNAGCELMFGDGMASRSLKLGVVF
ncbi:MAG: hypothetical protein FD123_169 [Bacteroidetes bacterium]|nr:MAG: hypothetical protein FD123_169 [Bacteroidota bacterium]